jgi:hypothetical protein
VNSALLAFGAQTGAAVRLAHGKGCQATAPIAASGQRSATPQNAKPVIHFDEFHNVPFGQFDLGCITSNVPVAPPFGQAWRGPDRVINRRQLSRPARRLLYSNRTGPGGCGAASYSTGTAPLVPPGDDGRGGRPRCPTPGAADTDALVAHRPEQANACAGQRRRSPACPAMAKIY